MKSFKKFIFIAALLMVLLMTYLLVEPLWLNTTTLDVASPDIPEAFDGTRIVFITDIHHGPFLSRNRIKQLVQKINGIQPDIVVFGGDYVHRDKKYFEPCFQELSNISATLGMFGVLGNHDHWEGATLCRESMTRAGIECIDNQGVWVKRKRAMIKVGGVGDLLEDIPDLSPTVTDVKSSDFVLLLSHNPDFFESVRDTRIDLALSGHTHGGQVTFFGRWAPVLPSAYGQKYRSGLVDTGYTKVYVSNGIGTTTPPVRFLARPEILLVRLHKDTNKRFSIIQ